MRTMLRFWFPVEKSNAAIKDGSLPKAIGALTEMLKPECAYFLAHDGQRGGFMVFDMKDSSDIPSIAEQLFFPLHAKLDFQPVMNLDDLKAGLEKAKNKGVI